MSKGTSSSTLIRNGTLVCGSGVFKGDILFKGETIQAMGSLPGQKADIHYDADGLLVLPGGVDTHVHFNDEFMNTVSVHDYETGTIAAALGGVTTVIDFSNQIEGKPLIRTLDKKREEAAGKALIDWGVHPVITRVSSSILKEIPLLVKQGAPTIKCYTTYRKEGLMVDGADLRRVIDVLKRSGGRLMVHAEDNDSLEHNISLLLKKGRHRAIHHARSRPPSVENAAIRNCIDLAQKSGGSVFIVHMSTAEGVDLVARARAKGIDITAETCTHYLVFTEEKLQRKDGIKWICSPPLRKKRHQDKLWEGIRDGRVAMVSSDDAAYSLAAKRMGIDRFDLCPNGIPGVAVRIPILFSEGVAEERLSLVRFVDLVATQPAKQFGLFPKKGILLPGSDADIVLLDPHLPWIMTENNHHMATDWNAYSGKTIKGSIRKVFSRGELIVEEGKRLADTGRGCFVPRYLKNGENGPSFPEVKRHS